MHQFNVINLEQAMWRQPQQVWWDVEGIFSAEFQKIVNYIIEHKQRHTFDAASSKAMLLFGFSIICSLQGSTLIIVIFSKCQFLVAHQLFITACDMPHVYILYFLLFSSALFCPLLCLWYFVFASVVSVSWWILSSLWAHTQLTVKYLFLCLQVNHEQQLQRLPGWPCPLGLQTARREGLLPAPHHLTG